MRPITRLPLISLRTRESGTPFKGVRWIKLPGDHGFVLGEKIRLEISYSPYVSDENVDTMFNALVGVAPHQYFRMTNTEFIWELVVPLPMTEGTVGEAVAGLTEFFRESPWIDYATCEVYGAGPLVPDWTKWLLIGGGLAVGGVAIGYALK